MSGSHFRVAHRLREKERVQIQELFKILHFFETIRADYVSAGLMLNQLRSKGITIPASDCLIAAHCIRHKASLLTLDNDFKHIPELQLFL